MIRKLILNEAFGILALSLLLIPQVAHTVYVFKVNSQYLDPWFSWTYAVGVDLAILIFTVKGWLRTSILFFFGTLAHNLVYQFFPETIWSGLLICIMLSGTIFLFSHLFYKDRQQLESDKTSVAPEKLEKLAQLERLLNAGIRLESLPFQCPECGEAFSDSKKLNGHISAHKAKKEWNPETYENWEAANKKRADLSATSTLL